MLSKKYVSEAKETVQLNESDVDLAICGIVGSMNRRISTRRRRMKFKNPTQDSDITNEEIWS